MAELGNLRLALVVMAVEMAVLGHPRLDPVLPVLDPGAQQLSPHDALLSWRAFPYAWRLGSVVGSKLCAGGCSSSVVAAVVMARRRGRLGLGAVWSCPCCSP